MKNLTKAILFCSTTLAFTATEASADPVTGSLLSAAFATWGPAGTAITIFGAELTLFGSFLFRAALGLALNALTPKPDTGLNGYNVTVTGSALDHQIVYGKVRCGGVKVYHESTGTDNLFYHEVIAFTGHEIESFEEVYFNDELLTLDGSGNVTAPSHFVGKAVVKKHLGSTTQTADTDLVAASSKWTTNHRLQGISYLYIKLMNDPDAYPNGVPDVSATIKGKKVYDPRTTLTVWSDNPALCIRDYLLADYGLKEVTTTIDDTLVQAAANVCDETTTLDSSTRYTCNGNFTTGATPHDILGGILTSMGGLLWYSQGQWRMKPAYWTSTVLDLDEDDLRSTISVGTRHSRRDNFNSVTGVFRGAESNWQNTDYPPVTNAAYVSADNGLESSLDLNLKFTDTSGEARRIARVALERNRQQLTVNATFGYRALSVQVGDNVTLSNTRFGWTNKAFEVTQWSFGIGDALNLEVRMTLREISESVFDEFDDGIVYEQDNTTLLSPYEVPTIGISLSSELLILREKLTNVLTITTTSTQSERVDFVEVQYKADADSEYTAVGTGEIGKFQVLDIDDGTYDIRARAINTFGVRGSWEYFNDYTISGLSLPPSDVTGFIAEVNAAMVTLEWDAVSDLDLSYYEIRYTSDTSGVSWGSSYSYVEKVPRPATSISVPARSGTFLIKAFDKTGVPSTNTASVTIAAADIETFTTTLTQTEDPTFSGTKTNTTVVSSNLRLNSTTTGDYEFSTYIDIGSVKRARVRVDITASRHDSGAGLFDDLVGNIDSLPGNWDDLTAGTTIADTNIKTYEAHTNDDPAGTPTWSAWKRVNVADISARAFKFKIELESNSTTVTPSISALDGIVEYN